MWLNARGRLEDEVQVRGFGCSFSGSDTKREHQGEQPGLNARGRLEDEVQVRGFGCSFSGSDTKREHQGEQPVTRLHISEVELGGLQILASILPQGEKQDEVLGALTGVDRNYLVL